MLRITSILVPAMAALFLMTSAGAQAPDPNVIPAVVEAKVVNLMATVTAVDPAARKVTLRGEDGTEVELELSDKVKNIDQIKAGDRVTAKIHEATAIMVRKAAAGPPVARTEVVQVASPGEAPGGITTHVTEIAATVENVDNNKRELTLKLPGGETQTINVGETVKNLKDVQKGDQLVIRYTEEVAIALNKQG
jgi:hypothetical protein